MLSSHSYTCLYIAGGVQHREGSGAGGSSIPTGSVQSAALNTGTENECVTASSSLWGWRLHLPARANSNTFMG